MTRSPSPRRALTAAVAALLLLGALAGCATTAADEVRPLRISEAGGASGDAMQSAYLDPFTETAEVPVLRTPQGDLGSLEAAARSGSQADDLVELDSISAVAALALELAMPVDWDLVDPIDPLAPEAQQPYGLGWQYYATIPAWRAGTPPLADFTDFFDPESHPGTRAVPDLPSYALPIALVADGVDPADLYPLDVDRAFAVLDRIADDVLLWTSGAAPAQLLQTGEAAYAMAWSGRVVDVEGIEVTFDQGLIDIAYLVIPAGAPDPAAAHRLLQAFTDVDRQVAAARLIPYGAGGADFAERVDADLAARLPGADGEGGQFVQEPTWWAQNYEEVLVRWEDWKAGL